MHTVRNPRASQSCFKPSKCFSKCCFIPSLAEKSFFFFPLMTNPIGSWTAVNLFVCRPEEEQPADSSGCFPCQWLSLCCRKRGNNTRAPNADESPETRSEQEDKDKQETPDYSSRSTNSYFYLKTHFNQLLIC